MNHMLKMEDQWEKVDEWTEREDGSHNRDGAESELDVAR